MTKSLKRMLNDAAELVAITGITHNDVVDVSVFLYSIQMHLKPAPYARVFRSFGLHLNRLRMRRSESTGDLHVSFTHKGADWRCVIDKQDIEEMMPQLGYAPKRITSPPATRHLRQPETTKAIAAPAAKLRRLSAPPAATTTEKPPTQPGQMTLFDR